MCGHPDFLIPSFLHDWLESSRLDFYCIPWVILERDNTNILFFFLNAKQTNYNWQRHAHLIYIYAHFKNRTSWCEVQKHRRITRSQPMVPRLGVGPLVRLTLAWINVCWHQNYPWASCLVLVLFAWETISIYPDILPPPQGFIYATNLI